MDVVDAVAGLPRRGGRHRGDREQSAGRRMGQTAYGDGPGREVLRGPGHPYRERRGYRLPPDCEG